MAKSDVPAAPVADRIVFEPERKTMTGFSRTTAWRLEQRGHFPRRFEVSPGRSGWLLSEIQKWIKERAANRSRSEDS